MKKIIVTISSLLMLMSCTGNPSSTTKINPPLSYKVFCSDKSVEFLSDFDESKVSMDLDYGNGNIVTLEHKDLVFDYSSFNNIDPSFKTKVKVYAKDNPDLKSDIDLTIKEKHNLKLLFIGNSFSYDCMYYLDSISKDLGLNMTIGNVNLGGSSINDHIYSFQTDREIYAYQTFVDHSITSETNTKITYGINKEDWDYISLQQTSPLSGVPSSYKDLDTLVNYVNDALPKTSHAKIIFHQTWAFRKQCDREGYEEYYHSDQAYMYQCIMDVCTNTLLPKTYLKTIIPNGTAIQNGRSSFIGDNFNIADGFHLNDKYGRYTIALTTVKTLTGANIDKCNFAPSGTTDREVLAMKEAANNAYKTRYSVTKSTYID